MTVEQIQINHPELGLITINTSVPKDVQETIGDVLPKISKLPCFYYALVLKGEDGAFNIENLRVIKPDDVDVGWHSNSKGSKNYITVIKNMNAGNNIAIYPSGIVSVTYNEAK